ncbi:hypothetical protein [Longimicrobium sp.]|uniref:hypothetical protein n=1 Tax=Longimicrobium sp. TaxID=2029185 RepID=UPI002BA3C3F9|nr:hypothetical protein [Longimicrobium sp.]HSU15092.1 hypothetical protein [Longimicrobium sp.]
MQRKKKLDMDALAVDSFQTTEAEEGRGTVHARGIEPTPPEYACTCANTCLCKTAYYHCGTGYYTIYSCDYTQNGSCAVTQ